MSQCPQFLQLEACWAAGAAGRGWERLEDAGRSWEMLGRGWEMLGEAGRGWEMLQDIAAAMSPCQPKGYHVVALGLVALGGDTYGETVMFPFCPDVITTVS